MSRALVLLCAVMLALQGCATAPPSPLTADAARSLRLEGVKVTMAPNASVSWAHAEQEYVDAQAAKGPAAPSKKPVTETGATGLAHPSAASSSQYQELVQSADGQSYIKSRVETRLSTALEGHLKPRMRIGSQPVRLDVVVHEFTVPSAIQRVVIGGVPMIKATAVLRDASTGAVLAERKEMIAAAYAGNGWGGVLADQMMEDLDVRLVNSFAAEYGDWLLPKV